MPRVIGIDPGTVSLDLCGLDDGRLFLDRSLPTAEALADPARFVAELEAAGPLDLVAGPSGYGLPLTRVQDATEEDLRLAMEVARAEIQRVRRELRDARYWEAGLNLARGNPGITPVSGLEILEARSREEEERIDALTDQARRNGISPGALR